MKKFRFIQKKYILLTLLLEVVFILFAQNCFSVSLFDCYGPGCSNEWCNSPIFIPFYPLYLIFVVLLFPTHWFIQIAFNLDGHTTDIVGFVISYVFMIPTFYLLSVGIIRILELVFRRLSKTKSVSKN